MAAEKTVVIEGLHEPALVKEIRKRMLGTLERIRAGRVAAKVVFADQNGPKGGPDTRCTIVMEIPRRRDVSVAELGTTPQLAFDASFDALKRSATREQERRRELARRPKKYFLAKRLLAPEITLDSSTASPAPAPSTPAPRRARRRPRS
jgi:ribosome-associated translation inhibitor RaiA